MVNEIYDNALNTKENIDGVEDIKELLFYPQERTKSRLKNVKVYTQDMLSDDGLHFDRVINFFDNNSLQFDGQPDDRVLNSVTCPNNKFVEDYRTSLDIDNTNILPNMTSWYKLDNDILDYKGSLNGTWSGTSSFTTGHQYDYSANFTGSNYIKVVDDDVFSLDNDLSFSLLAKRGVDNVRQAIVGKGVSGQYEYELRWIEDNRIAFLMFTPTASAYMNAITTNTYTTADGWIDIKVEYTKSPESVNLYINNVLVASDTTSAGTYVNGTADFTIGSRGGSNKFTGQVSDIRCTPSVFTSTQRTALYNNGNGWKGENYSYYVSDFVNDEIEIDANDSVLSTYIVYNQDKYIKNVNLSTDNSELTYYIIDDEINKSLTYGNNSTQYIKYKIVNDTGSTQTLSKLVIDYTYW